MSETFTMTGTQKQYLASLAAVIGADELDAAYAAAAAGHGQNHDHRTGKLLVATGHLTYRTADLIAELRSHIYTSTAASSTPPFLPQDLDAVRQGIAIGW